jgi:hypothetical protein
MKNSKTLRTWLVVTCLCLNHQIVLAITPQQLQGSTAIYDPIETYTFAGQPEVVTLQPLTPELLPRGGTAGLTNLLGDFSKNGGWTFLTAPKDLAGSFDISIYQAAPPSGGDSNVGANFAMNFKPGNGDPSGVTFHWIQRVFDNNSLSGGFGTPEDTIDASLNKPLNDPGRLFYDYDVDFATPPHFEDDPIRPALDNTKWSAELFLASIPTANSKEVTIYNGVSWGWSVAVVPEANTGLLLIPIVAAMLFFSLRQRWRARSVSGAGDQGAADAV